VCLYGGSRETWHPAWSLRVAPGWTPSELTLHGGLCVGPPHASRCPSSLLREAPGVGAHRAVQQETHRAAGLRDGPSQRARPPQELPLQGGSPRVLESGRIESKTRLLATNTDQT